MTDVRLTFGGDSRGAEAAATALVEAARLLRATFAETNETIAQTSQQAARTVQESARENVAAMVAQQEELVALAAEYRAVGAAATQGSVEQRAAARLAAEANYRAAQSLEVSRAAALANASAISRIGAATGGTTGLLGRFNSTLGSIQSSLLGVAAQATRVTALVGVGLAAGVAFVGVRFDSMKEQAQIAFETLTNSATKGKQVVADLIAFAARTPFRVANITQTAQTLVAMGVQVDELIPTLRALGDAAAATGRGQEGLQRIALALGQIRNSAQLHAQDMNQLIQAGINAWGALADASGKSIGQVRQAAEGGAISGRQAYDVLLAYMEKRFAGMMERQSRTASGLWSTIADTASIFMGSVMAPTFGILETQMTRLTDHFVDRSGNMTKAGQDLASTLGDRVGRSVQRLVAWFEGNWQTVVSELRRAASGALEIGGALVTIIRLGARVVSALGGPIDAAKTLVGMFVAVRIGVATTAAVFPILTAAGVGSMTAIRAAIISTGIGLLLAAIGFAAVEIITHWKQVGPYFKAVFAGIVEAGKLAFWTVLNSSTLAIQGILYAFSKLPFGIGRPFKDALDGLRGFIDRFKPDFGNVIDAFHSGGDASGRAFRDAAEAQIAAASGVTGTGGSGTAAAGSPNRQGRTGNAPTESTFVARGSVVRIALGAAASPSAGSVSFHLAGERTPYDCSAFVQAAFRNAGLPDPGSTTYQQVHAGTAVSPSDIQPGDIVLWDVPGDSQPAPNHVGIYVGNGICVHDRGAHGGVDRIRWNYYRVVSIRRVAKADRALGKGDGNGGLGGTGKLDLSGGTGGSTTEPDLTRRPDRIRIAFTNAERAGNVQGEIAALDAYIDYLEKQKQKGKQIAAIEETITATVLQIRQLRADVARKAPRGSTQASLTSFGGTIRTAISDQLQALVDENLGPNQNVSRALDALHKIQARLTSGAKITAAQLAELRNSYRQWGDVLKRSVTDEISGARAVAEAAAAQAERDLNRSLSRVATATSRAIASYWDGVLDSFDRETNARVSAMQAAIESQVRDLQITVSGAFGSFAFGGGIAQTPAEAELAGLARQGETTNLSRGLADAQTALQRARIIGDPVMIRDAQRAVDDAELAVRRDSVQERATLERSAAERQLQDAQDALRARLQAELDHYQAVRAATRTGLDQAREDQNTKLDEMGVDLADRLSRHLITWNEYVRGIQSMLAGVGINVDLSNVAGPASVGGQTAPVPIGDLGAVSTTSGLGGAAGYFMLNRLQTGGYFRSPYPGLVASHEPEYVVADSWLDGDTRARLRRILQAHRSPGADSIPTAASASVASSAGGGAAGGGGTMIYSPVYVQGSVVRERELSLLMRDHLVDVGKDNAGNVFGGYA